MLVVTLISLPDCQKPLQIKTFYLSLSYLLNVVGIINELEIQRGSLQHSL